jgi:hypothetical protein
MELPFAALAEHWRDEAARLEHYGAGAIAAALEACAAELDAAEREYLFETLTLEEAAEESGLSYDTIGRKVRTGELPNAGEKGRPRVRRCDLLPNVERPALRSVTDSGEPDVAAEVLRARH